MKPELQRIAIAEACGWRIESDGTSTFVYRPNEKVGNGYRINNIRDQKIIRLLPDYLNDLNAMHDAKKALWKMDWSNRYAFNDHLANILKGRAVNRNEWDVETLLDATADQEAEAFLRTLNKWDDEP